MNSNRLIKLSSIMGIISIALLFGWFLSPTEDSVMEDFHKAEGRAEDMLMDPLILNANLVKKRVIQDIQDPSMDKRRYAISFLGNERITEAIPVLFQILNNESEKEYFRFDALESIWQIDEAQGRQVAKRYASEEGHLGRMAKMLLEGSFIPHTRSKTDAFFGRHY